MLRILVTNASSRKAVPIIRALGRAGFEVDCTDTSPLAMGFFSKYCSKKFTHPKINTPEFWDTFMTRLREHPYDVILPLNDDMLLQLSSRRNEMPHPEALLLPEHDRLLFASDKSKLVPFAGKLGIPIPTTLIVSNEDDLEKLPDFSFPLILKPSEGSGSRGVTLVSNTQGLRKACQHLLSNGHRVLVQEVIPVEGRGMGYCALFNRDGNLIAEFMHQRLREYPLSGGPSTLRESIWNAEVAEMSRKLLRSLEWVGLAMVEYKMDPRDGKPKLMEVNPRFWGSIALPIYCGIDFPLLVAQLTTGLPVKQTRGYPLGKKARWLWPGDILYFCASLSHGKWPKGFMTCYGEDTCDDLLSWEDPWPNIVLTFNVMRKIFSPQSWKHVIFRR